MADENDPMAAQAAANVATARDRLLMPDEIPMLPDAIATVRAGNTAFADAYGPVAPKTVTTVKPTDEEIAEHQRKHGIKPSDLLPTGADPSYRRMLGIPEAVLPIAIGGWNKVFTRYKTVPVADVVNAVDSVSTSPEYVCQQCGKDYLYVDAKKTLGDERAAVCFCSVACEDKYLRRNVRGPAVGGEIRLGEPRFCVLGRSEEQIEKAQSDLVVTFMAEDAALVYAAVGDVPFVAVQDSVVYVVSVEQLDLLQRLFRLRSKLPKGFKIVADAV